MSNLDLCSGSVSPIYPPGQREYVTVIPLEVTENGTFSAPRGFAYNPVTANVEGGGSVSSGADVILYDYDGTVVQSYSAEDFANLTALPANPSHEGLTAQGWNWSLEDAKAYVAKYGKLNIGQMYVTDDGKTRLYLNRVVSGDEVKIPMTVSEMGGATINWGDGTTTVTDSTALKTYSHTYSADSTPVITIEVTSGSVVLGSGGIGIGGAFVKRVEIGDGVTSIGKSAFSTCYSLASVTIPDGVTSIGDSAFNYCYSLASVTIPDGVTSIGNYAFGSCSSLASVTIPDGVTSIGNSAFSNCYSLASVTIPDSVTSIGDYAFSGCYSLASVTIPDGVTSIGSSDFNDCYSLASVTIPDSVTSIGNSAFGGCRSLASVTIPDGVTSIGNSAFNGCSLTDCYLNATTPPTLGGNVFRGAYTNFLIHVPAESVDAYKSASGWSNYADHIVAM